MTQHISRREGASLDLYSNNVFLPNSIVEKLNYLIRKFKLEIPEDFSAREAGDLFTDEDIVLAQLADKILSDNEADYATEIRAAIVTQRQKKEDSGVYFVYAPIKESPSISYFLRLGHVYGGE